jgi:hypothetical protein
MKKDLEYTALFEFRRIGGSVKVSAIDPATNTEVSIVGPSAAGQHVLKMVALRKLQWVLARQRNECAGDEPGEE